jgi:hypothetical protein
MSAEGGVASVSASPDVIVMQRWLSHFCVGQQALQERYALVKTKLGGEYPYQLSLMVSDSMCASTGIPSVLLVAWLMPSSRSGREVVVRNDQILAVMPVRSPKAEFKGEVILPVIGEHPHRQGPANRPALPRLAKQLKTMWEAAISTIHACNTESLSLEECAWCESHSTYERSHRSGDNPAAANCQGLAAVVPGPIEPLESEPVITCCVCLLPWHATCVSRLVAAFSSNSHGLHAPALQPKLVPPRFAMLDGRDPICSLCRFTIDESSA